MAEEKTQSFAKHRAIPHYFLIALLVLAIDVLIRVWYLIQAPSLYATWSILASAAIVVGITLSRNMALTNQNRIIRLEMRVRLERVLATDKRASIQQLTLGQLIALRFASDTELPALVDAVLAENLTKQNDIKSRIKDWQADWLRV